MPVACEASSLALRAITASWIMDGIAWQAQLDRLVQLHFAIKVEEWTP